jgi:hypothetical protein
MNSHIDNRDEVLQSLREELVGPSPQGKEVDCTGKVVFEKPEESFGPWMQKDSKEEILLRDNPTKRYGVGVLYPLGSISDDSGTAGNDGDDIEDEELNETEGDKEAIEGLLQENGGKIENDRAVTGIGQDTDSDDFELASANTYKPSSMAVSFLADLPKGAQLIIEANGGRYRKKQVNSRTKGGEDLEVNWWLRSPVSLKATIDGDQLCAEKTIRFEPTEIEQDNVDELDLRIEVYSRPYTGPSERIRLLTVCLVNRTEPKDNLDSSCLFQAHCIATITPHTSSAGILPYPKPPLSDQSMDDENESIELLYRNVDTYAVGHGCSANWPTPNSDNRSEWVSMESLPSVETPSITPDIILENGSRLGVPMAELAGLVEGKDGFDALEKVVSLYEEWIEAKRQELEGLDDRYQSAGEQHLEQCMQCVKRMSDGLEYLSENELAGRAFQLANHAILLQQVQSSGSLRQARINKETKKIAFSGEYSEPDIANLPEGRGNWRAFQIAFLLMTVKSVAEDGDVDRKVVELIWFPTGGGKTEAYLGLSAYSMFLRRLRSPEESGVDILMRYTLRLLTTQQFLRAGSLICAMECIRKQQPELGNLEFSIGIWLGGETTPNNKKMAKSDYSKLAKGDKYAVNKFLLDRCPWCNAQMGADKYGKVGKKELLVIGYEPQGNTVVFKCPDFRCLYSQGLPIYVIDEDIYEKRPSLVIGTVDKFAMLAWRPEARSLFGIGSDGERFYAPPGLIIQDELHLISGPLGSMVGLYETVIEELCTDRRNDQVVLPKIVCSTATIRRYKEQVQGLYGRDEVTLFPPPGLDAADSFFARYARDDDGTLQRGRIYVGVHGPGLGSIQTAQVRAISSLLQAPMPFSPEERDPWWSLILFFNSLRELGTTLSLLQSDIPDYLKVIKNRIGVEFKEMRRPWNTLELTGRMKSDEVPRSIAQLQIDCTDENRRPVDACLASSIMEVGVDISRLSLMLVTGQPKSTSQYIQVTGRVGREWWERPGLIVTVYGASKPRDRSHYEKFKSYHERLYAQVEPTSVTPFSPPALDRALHAIMATYVRQLGDEDVSQRPYPFPESVLDNLKEILMPRVEAAAPEEIQNFVRVFDKRILQWKNWQRSRWDGEIDNGEVPLLWRAGTFINPEYASLCWQTPLSMRNVDAECQAEITSLYLNDGIPEDA